MEKEWSTEKCPQTNLARVFLGFLFLQKQNPYYLKNSNIIKTSFLFFKFCHVVLFTFNFYYYFIEVSF